MDRMDAGRNAEVMAEAKSRGCVTTLDVFASTRRDMDLVAPLLPHTDFFIPSEEEAAALSGLEDYEEIASFLLDQGAGSVILTLGGNGAMHRGADGSKHDMPAFDVGIICTCGCGDCFNAGFATGLHLGYSVEDSIRVGQATSAQNAMGLGSQAVVSDLDSTLEFIEKTPLKR